MRAPILVLLGMLGACDGSADPWRADPATLRVLDLVGNGSIDAESGWLLYEEVLKTYRQPPEGAYYSCGNLPGSEGWPILAGWLRDNRTVLPMLVEASRREHYGMSFRSREDADPRVAATNLGHNRNWANLLCVAAREAEAEGRLDEALEYVHAAYGLGRQITNRPLMIDQAVGMALVGIASRELRRLLVARAAGCSREQLDAMTSSPILTFRPRPVSEVLEIERLLLPDAAEDEGDPRFQKSWLEGLHDGIVFHVEATRAVVALARYRHEHGRYPESLDQLEKGVLSTPGRYRYFPPRKSRGPVLYTIDEDGKDAFAAASPEEIAEGRVWGSGGNRLILPVR